MSDDDTPPKPKSSSEGRAIAKRPENVPVTAPLENPDGALNSVLTGWQADRRAKSFEKLARESRSRGDYFKARGELVEDYSNLVRSGEKLRDLPQIIDHDREMREQKRKEELENAKRAAKFAEIGRIATEQMEPYTIALVKARKAESIIKHAGELPEFEEPVKPQSEPDKMIATWEDQINILKGQGRLEEAEKLHELVKMRQAELGQK